MIWLMLLLLGSLAVACNAHSSASERKKQFVSYQSPDEEDVEGNIGSDAGISRGFGALDFFRDDHDDSLSQMHITENSLGGLSLADGDLTPLFVGNTVGGGNVGPLGNVGSLASTYGQQQLSGQAESQPDEPDQQDLSNSNLGPLSLQNLGGFGDRISLFAGNNHHHNTENENSDNRDLDNNQNTDSDSASEANGENTESNFDNSVNLGDTVTDNIDGVQGGLASLFSSNNDNENGENVPPPSNAAESPVAPPANGGEEKPKIVLPNKQAMADALAKLLTSVTSQNGEDRQGVGLNDITGQELNQLDVSDEKLQKMLEQGLDDGTTGPLTPADTSNTQVQSSDAQPSDAPDEMPGLPAAMQGSESSESPFGGFGNLMQLPALHFQPGQTIHAHASDKPNDNEETKASPGDAAETALQVQENAQKEHKEKLKKLKVRLKLLRQKLEELEEEQAKKSHSSNSAKRTDAIKRLLIKNLKLAALIASKEIELEEAKGGNSSIKKEDEQEETTPEHETTPPARDPSSKAKPLTDLSKKAEEEVNALIKENKNKNKSVTFNFNTSTSSKSQIFTHRDNTTLIKEVNATLNKLKTSSNSTPPSSLNSYSKLVQRIAQMSNAAKKEKTGTKPEQIASLASLYKALKKKTGSPLSQPKFETLGCWKDSRGNLISSMEPFLRQRYSKDYKSRKNPLRVCAQLAFARGYPGFAIEDSGQCFAGPSILKLYQKHGKSIECNQNGTGGPLSLSVYKFTMY